VKPRKPRRPRSTRTAAATRRRGARAAGAGGVAGPRRRGGASGTGKTFLGPDFLLQSDLAGALYHDVAKDLPIVDYHGHLPPDHIASDHRFRSLTEIWLEGDHYKWRAMRANGVAERLITGDASDWEKFEAWARTVPYTLRNPLYHWTHMELQRPFGIAGLLLDETTARGVYERANALLAGRDFSTQGLLEGYGVATLCTTDDPADSLRHHAAHAEKGRKATRIYPTWRPDRALAIEDPAAFGDWLGRLEAAADASIGSYADFRRVLDDRHAVFHAAGCRLSDHGIETIWAEDFTDKALASTFDRVRAGKTPSRDEALVWKSGLLHHLAVMDHAKGWVQQYHLGAFRDNSTRLLRRLGPNVGGDSIGDFEMARPLVRFLDRLDAEGRLARTILYNLNPRDNELFAALIGSFQDGETPGKLQHGSAWWFLDQKDGMEAQMRSLSNMGLLSRFVGMLTDSRSFLSFSRHEYFRRLFCNLLAEDVRQGLLPHDRRLLDRMVRDVCFENALRYFPLEPGEAANSGKRPRAH
jgi:glucuronate isomerase